MYGQTVFIGYAVFECHALSADPTELPMCCGRSI